MDLKSEELKNRLGCLVRQNWIGAIAGLTYCSVGLLLFFSSLSYGVSCPEPASDTCDPEFGKIISALRAIWIVPFGWWAMIFYSSQQILILSGTITSETYPTSFFATAVLPIITFSIALFTWVIIGSFIQRLFRQIKI